MEVRFPANFELIRIDEGSQGQVMGMPIRERGVDSAAGLLEGDELLTINDVYVGHFSTKRFTDFIARLAFENNHNRSFPQELMKIGVRDANGAVRAVRVQFQDLARLKLQDNPRELPNCRPIPNPRETNLDAFVSSPRLRFLERIEGRDPVSGIPIGLNGCSLMHLSNYQIRELLKRNPGGSLMYLTDMPTARPRANETWNPEWNTNTRVREVTDGFFLEVFPDDSNTLEKLPGVPVEDLNPYVAYDLKKWWSDFRKPGTEILALDGKVAADLTADEKAELLLRRDLRITYRLSNGAVLTKDFPKFFDPEERQVQDRFPVTFSPVARLGAGLPNMRDPIPIPFVGLGGQIQFRSRQVPLFLDMSAGFNVAGIPSPYASADVGMWVKDKFQLGVFGLFNYFLDSGSYRFLGGIFAGSYLSDFHFKAMVGMGMEQIYRNDEIVYECTDKKDGPVRCMAVSGGPEDFTRFIPVDVALQVSF